MALYVHKDLEAWALAALREDGFDVRCVLRVYQPKHVDDGDYAEVLWLEEPGRACTSYIEPSGRIVLTLAGFG